MPSIGKGVWELRESDDRTWYRVVYLSRIRNVIYVLHCFEKQGRRPIDGTLRPREAGFSWF